MHANSRRIPAPEATVLDMCDTSPAAWERIAREYLHTADDLWNASGIALCSANRIEHSNPAHAQVMRDMATMLEHMTQEAARYA